MISKYFLLVLLLLATSPALADMYQDASNAKLPDARQYLGIAAYPPIANDLNPARHFSNLLGKTAATICIIGDSTMTGGPNAGNFVDPSQSVWGVLRTKLIKDNPQITNWAWGNYAIGATNESQPTKIGSDIPSVPANAPWFTDLTKTWFWYLENHTKTPNPCDVLFWGFGTNASNSGYRNGSTAATFIKDDFEAIELWDYKPNIVQITTKTQVQNSDTDLNHYYPLAQAGFHRTFAQSGGAGYGGFPTLKSLGFGLVDLSRNFTARTLGYDPAAQFMQSKPSCLRNGFVLQETGDLIDNGPHTVCTTTGGDYRMTLVLPGAGGTVLGGYGGTALKISGGYNSNYLRLNIASNGTIVPHWLLTGSLADAVVDGISVPTTLGQDVTLSVSVSGGHVRVWICGTLTSGGKCGDLDNVGTLALDAVVPRFTGAPEVGFPVGAVFATVPTGGPTANITEFWESFPTPSTSIIAEDGVYGNTCQPSSPNCRGGNNANHQNSVSVALDRAAVDAMNFHIPAAIPPGQNLAFNPSMEIDQANEGTAIAYTGLTGTWCADTYNIQLAPTAGQTATCARSTASPLSGESYSLLSTVTAAGAVGTNGSMRITQDLPTDVVAKLGWGQPGARSATLSYQIRSSVIGKYNAIVRNADDTAVFTSSCKIAIADTWTRCIVAISPPPAGNWVMVGGAQAVSLQWVLAAGSSVTVSPPGWEPNPSATRFGMTGQAQLFETLGATFQLAQVKFEEGTVATPYQRPNAVIELARLAQYIVKSYAQGTKPGTASTEAGAITWVAPGTIGTISVPLKMNCASPAIQPYSSTLGTAARVYDVTGAANVVATVANAGSSGFAVTFTSVAAHEYRMHWTATCKL